MTYYDQEEVFFGEWEGKITSECKSPKGYGISFYEWLIHITTGTDGDSRTILEINSIGGDKLTFDDLEIETRVHEGCQTIYYAIWFGERKAKSKPYGGTMGVIKYNKEVTKDDMKILKMIFPDIG